MTISNRIIDWLNSIWRNVNADRSFASENERRRFQLEREGLREEIRRHFNGR